MMSFKHTALWRAAFEEARSDATPNEQARLAGCYEAMRQRASTLVAKIASDLPHMTVHDVTHLDALWDMASIAASDNFNLNPAEAFVFGGAILLHDAAMTLATFSGGLAELREQTEWRDLNARYMASVPEGDSVAASEAENRATADALRLLHAKQAENLPMISWMGPQKQPMFIIEDQQVRNFYGQKIGKIAYSHWWQIAKVEEELSGTLGALPDVTNCTVDLLKVACLLRVADVMHLDQRRAPAFDFALTQPTGVSADHWKFQERMAKPFVKADALVYTAQPPFEVGAADAWWTAFDALQMVDRELRDVDRVLRDRQRKPLVVRRVEGAHSPSDLSRTVETVGWTPVDSSVRVSDVPKIVATLGGSKLYGESAAAPLRELIQNGLDAITARRRLQGRPSKWGELHVTLQKRNDGFWLCVEDNGVGMSQTILTGPLIDFGNSFWRSSLATQEFPGLAAAGMKSRGKYGIGFFSIFMLGDQVRVITRRFDRDMQSSRVLEFFHGLGSRPNMRNADPKEVPIDGGTRVEVKLRNDPFGPNGLLYRESLFGRKKLVRLSTMIAAIAPACDATIIVTQDGEAQGFTAAGDWLSVSSSMLLKRIKGDDNISDYGEFTPTEKSWQQLIELRAEDGKLYGRACIALTSHWSSSGLVTVDGLAASKIGLVAGILIGLETTASRNSARPIVPPPVLASWSSEQAITIAAAEIPEAEKAIAAAIVMACGGDVGELPIVWWQEKWMTSSLFLDAVKMLDRLEVHNGSVRFEDDDYVSKREFEDSFNAKPDLARTVDSIHFRSGDTNWIDAVTQRNGLFPLKMIEVLLSTAWGQVECDEDTSVVGEVNGTEIHRRIAVYTRISDEAENAD